MSTSGPTASRTAFTTRTACSAASRGIPRDESEAILEYLCRHAANPLFQCRFKEQPDSIAFWDNRCAQHHAIWDYWPHTRSGARVTVKGDKPY